ncbi:MAG: hypothetical protein ACW98D_16835 [Promethearchaeota archaeon]|jgi:hypothetical protein
MIEKFRILEVTCPSCSEMKSIKVPEVIFLQKKFGTVKIQVPVNAVCSEHQFIVFVDTKGIVRGYEKIDIHIGTSSLKTADQSKKILNLRNLIDIFGLYGVFNLIHSLVFVYPTYVLKDSKFDYSDNILNGVNRALIPEICRGNKSIQILDEPNINKIKIKEKDALILDTKQNIYQTPWKEKLKFEEQILKRALDIIDEQRQFELIQQDITNFVREVNYTLSILANVNEIYDIDLTKKISKALKKPTIKSYRVNLIKEYIKRRYSVDQANKIKTKLEKLGKKFDLL